jgi:hypothetical protein
MPASQAGRGGFESRLPLQAPFHQSKLAHNLRLGYAIFMSSRVCLAYPEALDVPSRASEYLCIDVRWSPIHCPLLWTDHPAATGDRSLPMV